MNTDSDIELNDLEAIEQRLNTENARGAANQERALGASGRGLVVAFEGGFEAA